MSDTTAGLTIWISKSIFTKKRKCKRRYSKKKPEVYDGEYEVDKVLGYKYKAGKPLFLLKWANFGRRYNSWKPMELMNRPLRLECREILQKAEDDDDSSSTYYSD